MGENETIISNDGRTIINFIANTDRYHYDHVKNVSVYRNGKLVQEYDELEFTGCNMDDFIYDDSMLDENPCNIFYLNMDIFVRRKYENSNWAPLIRDAEGNLVLKDDLSEEELFLHHNKKVHSRNDQFT